MEKEITKEQAQKALDTLVKYGATFYRPECVDAQSKWAKVGQAITHLSDNCKGFAELLYEALENWNRHSYNSIVNWVFKLGHSVSQRDLNAITWMISRDNIEVETDWDEKKQEYIKRHAKVSVVVEWLY